MVLRNTGSASRDEAFNRYHMPKMMITIEGKGSGIKTNIVNMVEIAKGLGRPASYMTKYFAYELGVRSKFDQKTGTCHVNGFHDTVKLAFFLEYFIRKYVLCYGCENPETEIVITKNKMIKLKCAACGFVSDVDMRHKLASYILKNPPDEKKGSTEKMGFGRDEKGKLKQGIQRASSSMDAMSRSSTPRKEDTSLNHSHSSPILVPVEEAAREQHIREKLSAVTAKMVMISANDPEKKARITSEKVGFSENSDLHNTLVGELKENLQKGVLPNQLKSLLGSLPGSEQDKMSALFEALVDGAEKGFAKEVVKKKSYLVAAVGRNRGNRGPQQHLLLALEKFCQRLNSNQLNEVSLILKALFDENVLDEEYIVQWYEEREEESPIWKYVERFIEWLQEAATESD